MHRDDRLCAPSNACSLCAGKRESRKLLGSESTLTNAIRLAVGSLPDVRLWRNNTGMLRDGRGGVVRYGLAVGSADLIGIVAPWGRMLSVEVKMPGKKPTELQVAWARVVREFGGVSGVVTSVQEAMGLVSEARMCPIDMTTHEYFAKQLREEKR